MKVTAKWQPPLCRMLPLEAANILVKAAQHAATLPRHSAAREEVLTVAITQVKVKFPQFFKE